MTTQQAASIERLRQAAQYVIDGTDGSGGAVPRTPKEGWEGKIKEARISYHGEVVAKAEKLELDRIIASLPPKENGGSVDLLELCEGKIREALQDPSRMILPEEELPAVWPRPKVQVKDEAEWEKIARELVDRGILTPVDQVLTVDGHEIYNGLFAVEKTGRDLADGRTAQRLIMDLRASNAILKTLPGDVKTLTGACGFTPIVLEDSQVISISGDDLVSSFYFFRLPSSWPPYLSFEREVSWKALGHERAGKTRLGTCVLPMGFNSSVGVMQHVHRRLALWSPDRGGGGLPRQLEIRKDREWPHLGDYTPVWCLYLDDSTFIRKLEIKVKEDLKGRSGAEQDQMRRAYQFWGIPFNAKKAVEEQEQAERLGAYLDGTVGRIGVTVKRTLECMSLGAWVLSQGQVTRKALQVFAGKEVHCLQFRRPLFSVYDEIWRLIASDDPEPYLNRKVCVEVMTSLCLAPVRYSDWRAEVDPFVMASDASETGGGFCMAKRLSAMGVKEAIRPPGRTETAHNGVVVIDMFAGIGGLLRSLDRAGMHWEHHVVIEKDKQCRRCIRRTWPGGTEFTDISKITRGDLMREIQKVDNPSFVIFGGGFPCQGFSKLSSKRKHFEDERSQLFYDMVARIKDIESICKELKILCLGFGENVVMDPKDRDEITFKLGWMPYLVESRDISCVKRPRYY